MISNTTSHDILAKCPAVKLKVVISGSSLLRRAECTPPEGVQCADTSRARAVGSATKSDPADFSHWSGGKQQTCLISHVVLCVGLASVPYTSFGAPMHWP